MKEKVCIRNVVQNIIKGLCFIVHCLLKMDDMSNGLPNGNHSMANTLKEMLKINCTTEPAQEQSHHVGEGDALSSLSKASSKVDYTFDNEEVMANSENKDKDHQTILLESIADGECVELFGDETHIVSNSDTEADKSSSASNKVKISTITKFEWEQRYYPGNLISVTKTYMAYSIKGRGHYSVRVINRHNSSNRVLLKGFTGEITDVAFWHADSNYLAAVDDLGNLIVWSLDQIAGSIVPEKKLHIKASDGMLASSLTHRVIWIPCVQTDDTLDEENGTSFDPMSAINPDNGRSKILVLAYGKVAEVWDFDFASEVADKEPDRKVERSEASHAFISLNGHDDEISDCELSPIGNVLATASFDGNVKFWQIQFEDTDEPQCLHHWKPHDGNPVSAVKFCDNKKLSEQSIYWRFLLTGCDRNAELKMWCTVTWSCLQVVRFDPPTPAYALPELNVALHISADYLVMSDINRKVLYVMQIKSNIDEGVARISNIAHYHLASQLLSIALIDAKQCKLKSHVSADESVNSKEGQVLDCESDEDGSAAKENLSSDNGERLDGVLVKLLAIQTRSLQSLDVRFFPNESNQQDSGSFYNTVSEEIKDQVSVGSIDDPASPSGSKSLNNNRTYLAAGDGAMSPSRSITVLSNAENKSDDNASGDEEVKSVDDVKDESSEIQPTAASDSVIAPDITNSTNSPVLLTPDAFMGSHISPGKAAESVNSSFTAVTPFSNSFYQSNQDNVLLGGVRNPIPNIMMSPSSSGAMEQPINQDEDIVKTPPSSPTIPRSSSPPAVQAPTAAAEILQSFCSRSSVKSPDLISSTSTLDEVKHDVPAPASIPAPPGLSGRVYSANPSSSVAAPDPADVFSSSVLVPVTSSIASGSSWPKAPDVTMSRPVPVRTPPTGSVQPSMRPMSNLSNRSVEDTMPVDVQILQEQPSSSVQSVMNNEEVLKFFRDFQNENEILLNKQQKELESINKKQHQMHKHTEAAYKRSEQQGDRLEKAVKSLTECQRRLSNDVKVNHTGISDAVGNKVDRVIKTEMKRTILPGMTQSLDQVKDQIHTTVVQQLTATDTVLKETVEKMVQSKEVVDAIAASTAKLIHENIRDSLPDIFFNTLIPSFERSCQAMFLQLSTTYHRGMEEAVVKLEKQIQFRLKPEQDRMQALMKEAGDAVAQLQAASKKAQTQPVPNVQKQISDDMKKAFSKFEERLTANILQAVKQQQTAEMVEQRRLMSETIRDIVSQTLDAKLPPAPTSDASNLASGAVAGAQMGGRPPLLQRPSIVDQQQQILKMLQQGNVNTAFQTALTASDLNLVMYVCETVDPSVVFGVSPCPLQQPILLSLIQQLSCELATKTEIKLKYLQEAVMNLDRRHQVTQEYMHSVLSALVQKLLACAQGGPLENPSLAKDLKMLAMAAQSLMK